MTSSTTVLVAGSPRSSMMSSSKSDTFARARYHRASHKLGTIIGGDDNAHPRGALPWVVFYKKEIALVYLLSSKIHAIHKIKDFLFIELILPYFAKDLFCFLKRFFRSS